MPESKSRPKVIANMDNASEQSLTPEKNSFSNVDVFDIVIGYKKSRCRPIYDDSCSDCFEWPCEKLRVLCVSTRREYPPLANNKTMEILVTSLLESRANLEIAHHLGQSPSQVYRLIRMLMDKYEAVSRHQLVAKLLAPEFVEKLGKEPDN